MALSWAVYSTGPVLFDSMEGMDPAANWLLGPAREAFVPEGLENYVAIPSLISFEGTIPPSLPADYPQLNALAQSLAQTGRVYAGKVAREVFEEIISIPQTLLPRRFRFNFSLSSPPGPDFMRNLADAFEKPESIEASPAQTWPDGTVVMGVIDDGIAFAHEAFRLENKTSRVEAVWIQAAERPPRHARVAYGRELARSVDEIGFPSIDTLLTSILDERGEPDEEAIYRAAGIIDIASRRPQVAMRRYTHGAHVMDIAAGYAPEDNRRDRPIIAVQMPPELVEQTSGAELDFFIVEAIDHILKRAAALTPADKPAPPVVITLSYGAIAGPHDGTTLLEKAVDDLLENYEKCRGGRAELVLSAGNSHLSDCHAEIEFLPGGPDDVSLGWRIMPDDRTDSYVEIWLPYDSSVTGSLCEKKDCVSDDRIAVRLITPAGAASEWVVGNRGATMRLQEPAAAGEEAPAAAEIKYAFVFADTKRAMFRIAVGPTEPEGSKRPPAPAGLWRIEVRRTRPGWAGVLHAYVQRDDTIYGYRPRGRQSRFEDAASRNDGLEGLPPVDDDLGASGSRIRRRGLVSAMATGALPSVIGAYEAATGRIADFSAGGPVQGASARSSRRGDVRPDALAPAEWSRTAFGTLAAGTYSGSIVAAGGTSAAAPFAARRLADLIAAGKTGPGWRLLRDEATNAEGRSPLPPLPKSATERTGSGRLDPRGGNRRIDSENLRGSS